MGAQRDLNAASLAEVLVTYRDLLVRHRGALNALNVYPVPDGDTGSNMSLTLEAVVEGIGEGAPPSSMAALCKDLSHSALMGARGNSGVILSQLLRGIADHFHTSEEAPISSKQLAEALVLADQLARNAVVRPVEGTILTVARAAGEGGASAANGGADLIGVIHAARESATVALQATPSMLEALARAGVVDAGGSGYLLFFDALGHVIAGDPLPEPPEHLVEPDLTALHAMGEPNAHSVADLRYEVMYLLEAPDEKIPSFKEVWAGIGDSIVVVGGDGIWNCHIHTDDVGAAIEAALDAGRPRQIRVTDLIEQVQEERWVRDAALKDDHQLLAPPPHCAVVAVVAGDGVARIFRSLGVTGIVAGGQSMNPSTAELVAAVKECGASQVVILPNNDNIRPVAEKVNELVEVTVGVVATSSIVEGFSALLSYDPDDDLSRNLASMTTSFSKVISGSITQAVRTATTEAGAVKTGDWLGLSGKTISVIGDTPVLVALNLLDKLVSETHELVTIIEGEGATAAGARRITEWLAEERPGVAVEVHPGGQPLYPYLFGIE
jgi:hypothetical protein